MLLTDGMIDHRLETLRYIGRDVSRAQVESDLTELMLVTLGECNRLFGSLFAIGDQTREAYLHALKWLSLEWYGREMSLAEVERENDIAEQAERDMLAGLPACESSAAQYFINPYAQHPRLKTKSDRLAAYLAGA